MRVRTRALGKESVYPCSKVDVKVAFGEGLVESVWFGLTPATHERSSRYSPQPTIMGIVVMVLSVHLSRECSLYIYQVSRAVYNDRMRSALVELMQTQIRDWVLAKSERSETAIFGSDQLLVELVEGRFRLHETRFR